jgi:hypothetical protein
MKRSPCYIVVRVTFGRASMLFLLVVDCIKYNLYFLVAHERRLRKSILSVRYFAYWDIFIVVNSLFGGLYKGFII